MKNKQLRVIVAVVIALLLAVTGLTAKTIMDANKQFSADGYVLVPSRDTEVTTNVNQQYYFSAGTNYRKKYGKTIMFKDTSNQEVTMGTEEFVHYNDGSLGAFTKGVVMDLAEIGDNQVTYYGVSDKTTLLKQGQEYTMSYLGNSLTLTEFIWKIADDTFMLVSPEIKIHLTDDIEVVLEDYVQVQYVAGGIARLVHQRGTYQTVSNDAYIQSDSGFELKLTERAFYNGLEKAVSLDEMVIDSSSNLTIDENEESLKIPTFRVVNGKDGADGADGFTGEDGVSGEDGTSGDNGDKGQNGFDGLEGDSGEWGYDGQVGEDGKDAQHSDSLDGIVGIVQESAPTIGIDPESYKVGTNSIEMTVKINDPNQMLTNDDIVCSIYRSDDLSSVVYQTTISSGMTGGTISTNNLQPGVDYVFIVEGSYESKANGLFSNVSFLTKLFRTDELGLSIEKVQVTENSIKIKTVKTDDSLVANYGIGLYLGDDTTNLTTLGTNSYSDGMEFEIKNDNLISGKTITPNTKYKIQLTNVSVYTDETKTFFSNVGVDVSKEVTTLKTKPYYKLDENNIEPVSSKTTKILTSSRYQTATVSIDTGIVDEHNGIKGYRYELYETLTDASTITTPIQTKEVQTMETVTFNIEAGKNYFARVVVLFDDNEKLVEMVTNPSSVVSLEHSNYPTVKFINLVHEYDMVSGYVMVEDNSQDQDMLLGHVSGQWPLILSVTAQTGEIHTRNLVSSVTPPAGNADTGNSIQYYRFEIHGLARDTTHTVSVSGYVNDTDMAWEALSDAQKAQKLQYLSGYNINVGSPTPILLSMRQVPNVDDDLFTIAVAFTDENGNDASYEVGNMEKITFRLVNASGVTIGNPANMMDAHPDDYTSDFSTYYARNTAADDLPYSAVANQTYSEYVLTDESFGAKGDLRIANGGDFTIYVEKAYDYTQDNVNHPYVTNELEISGNYTFKVEESHTRVADPNSAVSVSQIKNKSLETPIQELEDDTVVGLTIDTGYSLSDAHQVIYYVYELTSNMAEPIVKDDNPDEYLYKTCDTNGYWERTDIYKTKTINITTAPDAGDSVSPWVVYFDDIDGTNPTANLDDLGNKIFERGKVYLIRYEIVTNGELQDTNVGDKYPHCAYGNMNDMTVPFYRSNVFGIARQTPTLQRYLWDTENYVDNGTTFTKQQWKYKLNDPDNAILAYKKFVKADAEGQLVEYNNFDDAISKANATTYSKVAELGNLYDDNTTPQPKATYELVEMTGLANNKWYTMEIPYCIYEKDTRSEYASTNIGSILSVPGNVKAISHINADITTTNFNGDVDYAVNGVMVKDIGTLEGIDDEYGYRIRITLQGSDIEKVSALKVTVTGQDDSSNAKVVVYDPVPIEIQNGTTGAGANYFAYAYLEYVPIVKAGINHRTVTMQVEAYYNTNRAGMNSFTAYADVDHTNGYAATNNLYANGKAWALKGYNYNEENGVTSYVYNYQRITDELGTLNGCQSFIKDQNNKNLLTTTLAGSIFIPRMSESLPATNIGFADERTLALKYTVNPLVYTEKTDNSFSDVMYLKEMVLDVDEVGALSPDGTDYYVLEELGVKTLKIDFGNSGDNYQKANFLTGDGMPGIAYSTAGSSTGMSSATVQFDIKGALPGDDKGYYIYLYDKTAGNVPVALTKYEDADGLVYYLAEDGIKTTDEDRVITDDATVEDYGLEADAGGKKVTFAIRGLKKNNEYQVQVKAKDTQYYLQHLFDYNKNAGEQYYPFTTKSEIIIVSSNASFVYNSYTDKQATLQYAVQGSEGTGMRIYYKVYDENGNEVMCGKQTRTSYGYVLEPLGNQVKYYQSDMTLCNPVRLDFSPNGPLQVGKTYKIVYTAYLTTNAGVVINANETIGTKEQSFTMPADLKAPRASVRVVSGSDSVKVTVVMYDTEKTIYNGKFYIDAYDLSGNRITDDTTRKEVTVTTENSSTIYTGVIDNLPQNGAYKIVVTAPIDRNNDGVEDVPPYTSEITASTISTASATVSTSFNASGKVVLKIQDLVNFTNVNKIVYSIDSNDGATNYENVSKNLSDWTQNGSTYSFITGFTPDNGTYHYTLQFYNDNSLIGSVSGYFTK